MREYTDLQRERIAKREYSHYNHGDEIVIDNEFGDSKTTIGYISEIKDSSSGLQVYVVTDIKLPEQPTAADYEKVTHVTLLYRGSTGFNEIVDKPADVLADWVVNDIPMAIRTTVPDIIPTRASVQLRKAADFTNDSLEKYPNALFDFYGHSLGSMNVQYALASIDEKKLDRVSGAFIYNGPNTYRVLNEEQRQKVDYLHSLIYNYVDPNDLIGMGYSQSDGAVGQVFVVNTPDVNSILDQHMWGGYKYDAYGNMIDKDGKLVRAGSLKPIDIDGDGRIDINLPTERFSPRNLFLSGMPYGISLSSPTIHINSETLNQLANNIQASIIPDLKTIQTITQKCQAKNAAIQSKFEEREQQVSEKIKDSLATYGLTAVFSSLDHSLKRLVDQQGLFESLSQSGQLRYPFSYDGTPYVHDTRLNLALYDSELHSLKSKARSVSQSCQNERAGWFDSIIGRSTLLKSWKIIDDASRKLLKESDTVFEGSGLREGKSDGISQSLHEVFSVQLPDIAELERMTDNTLELIRGVAAHFTAVDTWLGENLKNGHFQGSGGTVQIPTSYQAYLERTGILDDVKDVLQAFDKQVEERSKKYAQQVASVYSSTFQQLSGSLGHWSTEVSTFYSLAETICARFPTSIYVERQRIVDKKPTTSWTYWGNMRALYPATIRASLETAKQELATILPQLTDASQQIQTAQFRLGNMQGELGRIVEQGVYRALDLDELTDSQKLVANLLDKMISELSFVRNTIESNMSGRAAQALAGQVQALNQRLGYYQQLVSDCFGTQTNPVAVASSQPTLSKAATHFSLNGYRPI